MPHMLDQITVGTLKTTYQAELRNLLGHIELVRRLDRAYDMLTRSSEYSFSIVSNKPLTFVVAGPHDAYTVVPSQQSCTCPDHLEHEKLCKHRLAMKLWISAKRATLEQQRSERTKEMLNA